MDTLETLDEILTLHQTLYDAISDIGQSCYTGPDNDSVLTQIRRTIEAIYQKAAPILSQEKAAEVRRCADAIESACDASILDGKPQSALFEQYSVILESCLCMEAISAASNAADAGRAIGILEKVLACDPPAQIQGVASLILACKTAWRQPRRAYDLGFDAFELNPTLCASITKADFPVHNYAYKRVKDVYFDTCPVCRKGKGEPCYCAMPFLMLNYSPRFNPVKLWMRCDACGQIFAYNYPAALIEPQAEGELGDEGYGKPRLQTMPIFGAILKRVLVHAPGKRLLDVGAGMGELCAAALEYGCDVEAVEISQRQAQRIRELLGIGVYCMDFLRFDTERQFDIVTMGDVLEHMADPTDAIRKAHSLLNDEGILWLSTPNFESGFSRLTGYDDPMWNEPWHITYFSCDGLTKLLSANGFTVLEYDISPRYNGSMEITARKT